jgi:hypothetical protein
VQIQFLRGPDNGCCFVQFETKADVQKALARNGANLGNNEITVSLPFGLQTCTPPPLPLLARAVSHSLLISISVPLRAAESGQRFAFNPQSRNIARDAPPTAILFGKEGACAVVRVRWCVCGGACAMVRVRVMHVADADVVV